MIFTLSTAGYSYSNKDEIDRLSRLGFTFEFSDTIDKYVINSNPEIDISSIEDLMSFIDEFGSIVMSSSNITIYDDYLE